MFTNILLLFLLILNQCYCFANSSIPDLFYKAHMWNTIKLKVMSFFFLINNRIVLKEKNQVHRGCTWKTVHQTLKLQRSRISKKLEQGKRLKDKLHSSKAWKNKDLRSKIDNSFPSKHLELSSHQIHHTTQWGIALHKSMLQCQPNEPCQLENKSVTLCSITQRRPKKVHTIDHNSSNRTMKKKMIRRFPTFFTHIAPINNCNTLIP